MNLEGGKIKNISPNQERRKNEYGSMMEELVYYDRIDFGISGNIRENHIGIWGKIQEYFEKIAGKILENFLGILREIFWNIV